MQGPPGHAHYLCRKTLLGAQARKHKISEKAFRLWASSPSAFRIPFRGVDSHAHPDTHQHTLAQESLVYILIDYGYSGGVRVDLGRKV
jgi:hypothetical protein